MANVLLSDQIKEEVGVSGKERKEKDVCLPGLLIGGINKCSSSLTMTSSFDYIHSLNYRISGLQEFFRVFFKYFLGYRTLPVPH